MAFSASLVPASAGRQISAVLTPLRSVHVQRAPCRLRASNSKQRAFFSGARSLRPYGGGGSRFTCTRAVHAEAAAPVATPSGAGTAFRELYPAVDAREAGSSVRELLEFARIRGEVGRGLRDPDAFRHMAAHALRSSYFWLHLDAAFRASQLGGSLGASLPDMWSSFRSAMGASRNYNTLFAELLVLFKQDYENIQRGCYKMPYDIDPNPLRNPQFNPGTVLSSVASFLREGRRVLERRRAGRFDDVWLEEAEFLPAYYKRTFHYQTDGYLSQYSAENYDYLVEALFVGGADAMRRHCMVPLAEFMRGRDPAATSYLEARRPRPAPPLPPLHDRREAATRGRRSAQEPAPALHSARPARPGSEDPGASPPPPFSSRPPPLPPPPTPLPPHPHPPGRQVACGTGRSLTFVKQSYPDLQITATDLSPFYLAEARKKLEGMAGAPVRFAQGRAERLPFPDASFDVLNCVYLFHEIPSPSGSRRRGSSSACSSPAASSSSWTPSRPAPPPAAPGARPRPRSPGGHATDASGGAQLGDREYLDPYLELFPRATTRRPFYVSYVKQDLAELFVGTAGFQADSAAIAFRSKLLSFRKPLEEAAPAPPPAPPAPEAAASVDALEQGPQPAP
eukprot:tig00021494_g21938.t1